MGRPINCNKCNKPKRPKGNKFKDLQGYCACGRPTVFTPEVIQKLEDAFSNALPDKEACLYAGISPTSLYNYQLENPEFVERKEALKLTPNIAARRAIVKVLGDANHAWRWLEKKDPEFNNKLKLEHSGNIEIRDGDEVERSPEEVEFLQKYQEARRKRIEDMSDKMEKPI
jgi:hypothetical protein